MRIPSGKTDQSIYFVAVDATDLKTREPGLATWTVYRSRNGAAEATYTTPTISEIDATNMPGVYALLVDEDTTIGASSDSEEYCVHITHAGMAPVTRTIELYRRDTTTGRTLSVDASSRALSDVDTIKTNPVVNGGTITFPTTATLASTTNITAGTLTTVTTATNVTTVNGLAANVITAASMHSDASGEIADAVWDEDASGHQTQGSFGQTIGDSVADGSSIHAYAAASYDYLDTVVVPTVGAIVADTNELQGDWVNGGRLDLILDARASQTSVDDLPTNAELTTALGTADDATLAQIALVKAVTDKLDDTLEDDAGTFRFTANALEEAPTGGSAPTAIEIADEVATRTLNADIKKVNGTTVNGSGTAGDPWSP